MKFLVHKFHTCGANNNEGPTQELLDDCYKVTNNNVTSINGIQKFILQTSGDYIIEAHGAAGVGTSLAHPGGKGASVKGTFKLKKGSTLYVLVGQQGSVPGSNWGGPGGGASYVALKDSSSNYSFAQDNCYVTPLIVAGGGGGSGDDNSYNNPKNGTDATCEELVDGGGISNEYRAAGGAGFSNNSVNDNAKSFLNGGVSCIYKDEYGTSYGSFGGGGCSSDAGAGGGGFKGGDTGEYGERGFGGSSYNSGTHKTCKPGSNEGIGHVEIYYKASYCSQQFRRCSHHISFILFISVATK